MRGWRERNCMMKHLLVLRSSANGSVSVSNGLIDRFLEEIAERGGAYTVVDRDLDAEPIPHICSAGLAGIGRPAPEMEAAKPVRALSDRLIGELKDADLILIGAPMYNFGIASTLKSWFDHVLRAGETFQYSEAGAQGLLKGKRAILFVARAGAYSDPPAAAMDYQLPYLKALLAFIGITDVDTIMAEGLAFGEEMANAAIANAMAKASELASALTD